MREDFSEVSSSRWYKYFIIWHFLAMILAAIIGFVEGDFSLFLSILIWTIIAVVAYKFEPRFYILSALILATIEEWLVYQFGGGLQGEAISLLHDFVNALPVFFGLIIGYYLVLRRYRVDEVSIYIMAGLHGSFIELLFQGIIFNPILLFLLGGPNFFIYGSIFVSPKLPEGEQEIAVPGKIIAWIVILMFMILGAIVADNLNTALGFP